MNPNQVRLNQLSNSQLSSQSENRLTKPVELNIHGAISCGDWDWKTLCVYLLDSLNELSGVIRSHVMPHLQIDPIALIDMHEALLMAESFQGNNREFEGGLILQSAGSLVSYQPCAMETAYVACCFVFYNNADLLKSALNAICKAQVNNLVNEIARLRLAESIVISAAVLAQSQDVEISSEHQQKFLDYANTSRASFIRSSLGLNQEKGPNSVKARVNARA